MSLHVHCTAFYSPATEALINNNNNNNTYLSRRFDESLGLGLLTEVHELHTYNFHCLRVIDLEKKWTTHESFVLMVRQ